MAGIKVSAVSAEVSTKVGTEVTAPPGRAAGYRLEVTGLTDISASHHAYHPFTWHRRTRSR